MHISQKFTVGYASPGYQYTVVKVILKELIPCFLKRCSQADMQTTGLKRLIA